jgi:hypothetical protein
MEILVYHNNSLVSSFRCEDEKINRQDLFIGLCQTYIKSKNNFKYESGMHYQSVGNLEYLLIAICIHLSETEKVETKSRLFQFYSE